MRGQHTNREIGDTLDKSVGAVESFFKRHDARHPERPRPDRTSLAPKVSSGIASRLGVADATTPLLPKHQRTINQKPIDSSPLEPVLIVSDAHIPYHSPVWWDLLLQVGRHLKLRHIVI